MAPLWPEPGMLARRVWGGKGGGWALARAALLLPAGAYRAAVDLRNAAYDLGLIRSRPLPLPAIGVGNLAVGGTGKSPLASFLALELARRGLKPGILLRGYGGGDEAAELAERNGDAVVVPDPDRLRGAGVAAARGAQVLVLDDCLQRRDLRPDLLLALVAAERPLRPMRPLPAGPWREGLAALERCDGVVVTCRTADPAEAAGVAGRLSAKTRGGLGAVARLELARFVPLSGEGEAAGAGGAAALRGRDVVALCGVGEPEAFAMQLERLGARVSLLAFGDHHAYRPSDVARAVAAAGAGGLVVTTGKDAVKLRKLWPPAGVAPACLVAELQVLVTHGADELNGALDRIGRAARTRLNSGAARQVPPASGTST